MDPSLDPGDGQQNWTLQPIWTNWLLENKSKNSKCNIKYHRLEGSFLKRIKMEYVAPVKFQDDMLKITVPKGKSLSCIIKPLFVPPEGWVERKQTTGKGKARPRKHNYPATRKPGTQMIH